MAPIVAHVATQFRHQLPFYKIDINKARALAQTYNISGVPAFLFFNGTTLVDSVSGQMPKKELVAFIKKQVAASSSAILPKEKTRL